MDKNKLAHFVHYVEVLQTVQSNIFPRTEIQEKLPDVALFIQ